MVLKFILSAAFLFHVRVYSNDTRIIAHQTSNDTEAVSILMDEGNRPMKKDSFGGK
jgi:hypothetical protein